MFLYVFVAISLAMAAPALWRKDYRLQFPCLVGLSGLYLVALPMEALLQQPDDVSQDAIFRFGVMAILCLVAAWWGYEWWKPSPAMKLLQFDEKKLVKAAMFLVAFGAFFAWKTRNTVPDIDPETTQWTGPIVIYSTLSLVMRYGAMLAAILFFRTRQWKYLLLALPQVVQYANLFLIGRRGPTGEIMVVTCVLLFFYRKWALPLWLMLAGIFAMAVFSYNIGTIRATNDQSLSERIQAIKAADPLHSISTAGMAEDRKNIEVYNGAKFMEAKARGGHYTLGLHFWNQIVFGFVPGQLVGKDVKESLKFKLVDDTLQTGYEKSNGTCETGIGEAFMAFGYLGCGLFFALGAFMRWLWEGATRNSVLHQLLLMLFTLPSLMTFSAQLWTLVNQLVNISIFVGPWLWWSLNQTPKGRRRKSLNSQ